MDSQPMSEEVPQPIEAQMASEGTTMIEGEVRSREKSSKVRVATEATFDAAAHFHPGPAAAHQQSYPSTGRVLLVVGSQTAAGYALVRVAEKTRNREGAYWFDSVIAIATATPQNQARNWDFLAERVVCYNCLPDLTAEWTKGQIQAQWSGVDLRSVTDIVLACIPPFSEARLSNISLILEHVKEQSPVVHCIVLSNSAFLSSVNQESSRTRQQSDIDGSLLDGTSGGLLTALNGLNWIELRYDVIIGPSFESNPSIDALSYLGFYACQTMKQARLNGTCEEMDLKFPGEPRSYTARRSFIVSVQAATHILLALEQLEGKRIVSGICGVLSEGDCTVSYADLWGTVCRTFGLQPLDPNPGDWNNQLMQFMQQKPLADLTEHHESRDMFITRLNNMVGNHVQDMMLVPQALGPTPLIFGVPIDILTKQRMAYAVSAALLKMVENGNFD